MEESRFPLHIPLVLTFQGYNTKQVSLQIDFAPVLPLGLSHSPYLVIFDSVPVPILLYLTVSNFCFRRKEASHTGRRTLISIVPLSDLLTAKESRPFFYAPHHG